MAGLGGASIVMPLLLGQVAGVRGGALCGWRIAQRHTVRIGLTRDRTGPFAAFFPGRARSRLDSAAWRRNSGALAEREQAA